MLDTKLNFETLLIIILLVFGLVTTNIWPCVFLYLLVMIEKNIKEYIQKRPDLNQLSKNIEKIQSDLDTMKLEMNSIKIDKGIRSLK